MTEGLTMEAMAGSSRDVFPLRFKNQATRAALRHLAEQTGTSMTEIAEKAIEHEVVLQGADLERRLDEALSVVRGYRADRDADAYIEAVADGERRGLDPFADVVAADTADAVGKRPQGTARLDRFGVAAAFGRD